MMVEQKVLTPEQVEAVILSQGKQIWECPSCNKQFNIHGATDGLRMVCQDCGGVLTRPHERLDSIDVNDTVYLPQRRTGEKRVDDDLVGKIIDGSEVLARIGEGGMGKVYQARHRSLNRMVAIKILSETLVGENKALARFIREARSAASLDHPNIVPVFNVGKEKKLHFISMQFVEGMTLADYIKREGLFKFTGPCLHQIALPGKYSLMNFETFFPLG